MEPGQDKQELDLLLPSSVTGPLWKSLLRNLRDRFFPEKLPPLKLTSRPVNTGMLIGDSVIEMGEHAGEWKPKPAHIHLFVPDADAVFARALQAGATVLYPIADMPYGERSGGVTDPFGNQWFIATPK